MATQSSQPGGSFYSYSSRRNLRQEEIAAYRRIAIATILIVALLVGGYFLGIPFLARLGSGSNSPVESNVPLNTTDKIPPTAPRLDSLPDAVRTKLLTVTGSAESGTTVNIKVNDQDAASTITEKDGTFSTQVSLRAGSNTIVATAKDTSNNVSKPSKTATVLYDAKPPSLGVSTPSDTSTSVDQPQLTVVGKTEPDASVSINDRQVVVQSDGSFSTTIQLSPGDNQIVVVATDEAGNTSKVMRTVTFNTAATQPTPTQPGT